MFAIYNLQGRHFRDNLEQLNKVRKTLAEQGAQLRPSEHAGGQTVTDHSVPDHARRAYTDMLHETEREAIVHAYQIMSHPVATVQAGLGIPEAWQLFREQSYHQLPVLDKNRQIVGMLSERNLLRLLLVDDQQTYYVRDKTVADVMSKEVITADPVSNARRIARVMQDYHLSALPIVDERDALVGLVSRSDILRAVTNDPPLSLWT